ncbi:hypothetical protein K457DRAFT_35048 [Linnemannia elongata AG-77]|uniref:Uncharacterized protein n=1 Tax=Linnemannia elongata AG-77 TaxID=1314771 RepID=A0A197JN32_9FUNG|nr:hypothetical protein K457DRAFT_35048 [Linnemannia elongata AG-77]
MSNKSPLPNQKASKQAVSTPPEAIDPAHILAYLASATSNYPQDSQFLETFKSLHPADSKDFPLRLYIVQQPAPAKHRRSYVETKDLRALCGHKPATNLVDAVADAAGATTAGGGEDAAASDLEDSVLVMRRFLEAPILTAETLARLPGFDGSTTGGGTSGSDSMRGDGSSNAGDDTSSSLADDDMAGGDGTSGGGMELSKMFLGVDHAASWMSNNASAYIDMCLSMGHSDPSDGSDVASPPPYSEAPSTNAPAQTVPEQVDGDIYDDEDEEDEDATGEDTREGKRVRHSTNTTNSHHALPQWFRPLVKDGEVQFEIWVVAFLKPKLLAVLPPKPCQGGGPHMQQSHSQWTEHVNELLDSRELQGFVRNEVASGRIGIDFKKIMAEKKDGRKSTRTVIR